MYRLFPCIPIFRAFFFLIKSAKRMCICDYVKNHFGTCKKCVFRFEKGYKQIIALSSSKHTAEEHEVLLTGSTKISERKGSISPYSSYGQLPNY